MAESLSVVAFTLAAVYLYVEQVQRTRTTGTFILPLVLCLQLASSALLPHAEVAPVSTPLAVLTLWFSRDLGCHGTLGVRTWLCLWSHARHALSRVEKWRIWSGFERLPSLDVLSAMVFRSTFIGWLALSGTILVGV